MSTPIFSLIPSEQQAKWNDIMGQMCAFVNDTNADVDMAYDWVCEMLEIVSFVDNETAWDSFYDVVGLAIIVMTSNMSSTDVH